MYEKNGFTAARIGGGEGHARGCGMEIGSLGYRTDLFFSGYRGTVTDRGDYSVILTKSNPGYYWGNFILFKEGPRAGDLEKWKAVFDREIKTRIEARHYAFGWDAIGEGMWEVGQFIDDGFNVNRSIVLTAAEVAKPRNFNEAIEVRRLGDDAEWEQATRGQIECREPCHDLGSYSAFQKEKMDGYRDMADSGLGAWFGAFLGGELVANLGIYVSGGVGRFQDVVTDEAFRNRGICGSLVYAASMYALRELEAKVLVMVADEDYHAAKIYERLGFCPTERQYGMDWWEDKRKPG